eukprot:Pgem_evm1s13141
MAQQQDLQLWLQNMELEEYSSMLSENGFVYNDLLTITKDELKSIGITNSTHIDQIMCASKFLRKKSFSQSSVNKDDSVSLFSQTSKNSSM